MKLFYEITNVSFKKDLSGRSVWYPWGIFGKGRVLPDKETEDRIRKFSARFSMVCFSILLLFAPFVHWYVMIVPATILLLLYYYKINSLAENSIISTQKLTAQDVIEASARSYSSFIFCFLLSLEKPTRKPARLSLVENYIAYFYEGSTCPHPILLIHQMKVN